MKSRILYNIHRHAAELCRLDCAKSGEVYSLGESNFENRMLLSISGDAEIFDKKLMRSHMTVR